MVKIDVPKTRCNDRFRHKFNVLRCRNWSVDCILKYVNAEDGIACIAGVGWAAVINMDLHGN